MERKKVRYLLVGGFAVRYHGYPRNTRDLDIWIGTDLLNAQKMVEVFQELGLGAAELTAELFQNEKRIFRLQILPLQVEVLDPIIGQKPVCLQRFQSNVAEQVEILTIQTGMSFDPCFKERVVDVLDGIEVNIISKRNLQEIKGSTDRAKDIQDRINLQ